jgi:ubiquinone/menaquinone biosynthesis C-methylase UbiE
MARIRSALRMLVPLVAVGGAVVVGRSIVRQRRHPEPFPATRARVLDNPLARRQAEGFLDALDVGPGMRVLDAGAGIGRLTIPLAARVGPEGEVVALDIQQEMLEGLEKRAADAGVTNVRTLRSAAGEGTLERSGFDRALLVAVLGEIPPDRRVPALREIREALQPGGILYVIEGPGDPHYQSRKAVARLGADAGFKVAATRRLGLARLSELISQP